jgi:hypothetical protein
MSADSVPILIRRLKSLDDAERESARAVLIRLDEAALEPLADAFYSGVNEALGLEILALVIRIGGWEARLLLADVAQEGVFPYTSWRSLARDALDSGAY